MFKKLFSTICFPVFLLFIDDVHAACKAPLVPDGFYKAFNPRGGMTRAVIVNSCNKGKEGIDLYLWAQCSPDDCFWGRVTALNIRRRGFVGAVYRDSVARRNVFVSRRSTSFITVSVESDYHDSRPNRTSQITMRRQ